MEKREATIPSKKEILESILKSCQRVMKEENDCFQKGEVEINYSALAE
ncbi:3438_t:CDS:1, partial [Racocetra persica]